MIKKLRIKFICIAMFSVIIVLALVIGGININNYNAITKKADETLNIMKNNDGRFPLRIPNKNNHEEFSNPEAFYETRYFTIILTKNMELVRINLENVASIDYKSAYNYALKIDNKTKEKGFIDNYRYLKVNISEDEVMYMFLDCSRNLNIYYQFLQSSIMMSLIVIILVLVLVIFFSLIITKPFAKTYQKQQQFITNASHDLKTPLTIINGSCEILEYNNTDNEWIETIKEQVNKLTNLTNKLVILAKMDETMADCPMTEFNISSTVEDVVSPYQQLLVSNNKKFAFNISSNITYKGNELLIREMLQLLFDNALKYSDIEGNIILTLSKTNRNIKLQLSNTTSKIPIGNLDKLFERFTRLDSSRNSQTGGHGIGLSVVKTIVDIHKGKIRAYSEDGKTIIFMITL